MTSGVKDLFVTAVQTATACTSIIENEHLGNSTPCTDWDLRALLNHMVYELLWVPDMLAGKSVAEVGDKYEGDVLGDDFHAAWKHAAEAAAAAVDVAGENNLVRTSFGNISAREYIMQVGGDIYIHAWDVDQSEHCSLVMDEAVAQTLYDFYLPVAEGYRSAGVLGPALPVPAGAKVSLKLLGLMGRQPAALESARTGA